MRKNVILALLLLLALGVSSVIEAQTAPKKKKKKKKKIETVTVNQDSIDAVRIQDSLAAAAAAAPPPDTMSALTAGLVADTSYMTYADLTLDTTRPVDGFYKQPILRGAKAFAFPDENKFNVKFYKRLWRHIDLTDSVNRIFSMPGQTLMSIIMDALKAGKIVAYADEGFTKAMSYQKVLRVLSDSTIVTDLDSLTGDAIGSHSVYVPFNPDSVTKLEIKEDIFVDKVRGRLITRIISLSPIKKVKSSAGDVIGEQHPFYLYFDQCRNLLASREVFDTQRDIYDMSYDDLFILRNFKTLIVKESNPGDLRIKDKYPNDEDRQKQEAERIERELREYKKNLWKY
ncbi:MAG: gldN [Flavipsychrobacter sp.]|jgi:gliding motility associated protien GldN|nr:gldN [Flavipsychrobacter sp.]